MKGRNDLCHCGSGLKLKKCHGPAVALAQAHGSAAAWTTDRPSEFTVDAYFGPPAPLSSVNRDPLAEPDEIGPRLLSSVLDLVDAGEDFPGPIFVGRSSPVHIVADRVEDIALERVRSRLRNGLAAKETFEGLPITLVRGRTGGLMLECANGDSSEPVARAAIAWSVAVNGGDLCIWGGRMPNGSWLLGLTL